MQHIEDYVAEKRNTKHRKRCEDRAENLSAIDLWSAKRAKQAKCQQRNSNSKEQKIARAWKFGEELIREKPGDCDHEADPDWPVPFSFHVDLAADIRRVHR